MYRQLNAVQKYMYIATVPILVSASLLLLFFLQNLIAKTTFSTRIKVTSTATTPPAIPPTVDEVSVGVETVNKDVHVYTLT